MKHKRKKSHHKESNSKKLKRKHKGSNHKKKFEKLRCLAMASGFHVSTLPSTSPSCSSKQDNDSDIVVMFDKQKEEKNDVVVLYDRKKQENVEESIQRMTKIKLSIASSVHLKDIPLPPENKHLNITDPLKLEDIPLPPSPKASERLMTITDSDFRHKADYLKKLVYKFRQWEETDIGRTFLHADNSITNFQSKIFTIMSYNVLAQQLLENHSYLYRKHDQSSLQWKYRSRILWREIQEADADILCLQEVQASHIDSFFSKLQDLGYKGMYKQRSNNNVDGCAIYYKTNKFRLVDSCTVEYFQNYGSFGCILDRDNIAIIARLAFQDSADSNHEIVVATTHLLYNPRRHDVKLAQCQVLLAELDRMSYCGFDKIRERPKYVPVIVSGDFNLLPHSPVYKLITEGYLRYSELAARSLTNAFYGQALQEYLLPFELQISHSCQHLGLLLHRCKQRNSKAPTQEFDVCKISKLYNSDIYKSPQNYFKKMCNSPLLYEEDFFGKYEKGSLHHHLNLLSVYKHQQPSSPASRKTVREATTHQDGWVTVDYIFYSGEWNNHRQCTEEGPLKLLSRHSLPVVGQCEQLKSIPNLVCGSDHLSLMARFVLEVK